MTPRWDDRESDPVADLLAMKKAIQNAPIRMADLDPAIAGVLSNQEKIWRKNQAKRGSDARSESRRSNPLVL